MVIRQLLACAGVKGGVTLADREPGLAEMPRPVFLARAIFPAGIFL
jgi:hypothetical protein